MTTIEHNKKAWDKLSTPNCPWSIPVTGLEIERARSGDLSISVAGQRVLPGTWLKDIRGASVLCLASGGGQQAPLLAAAGAEVCVMDLSEAQLALDRQVCAEHQLDIRIEQGSMTDLSRFADTSFDYVINPVSSCYVPDIHIVWAECARVIRSSGRLIAGAINPLNFLFEENDGSGTQGLEVKYPLPFVESEHLDANELTRAVDRDMVFTWSHSLEDLIQGQIAAGFALHGLLESRRTDERAPLINQYTPTYIMTLAEKL